MFALTPTLTSHPIEETVAPACVEADKRLPIIWVPRGRLLPTPVQPDPCKCQHLGIFGPSGLMPTAHAVWSARWPRCQGEQSWDKDCAPGPAPSSPAGAGPFACH